MLAGSWPAYLRDLGDGLALPRVVLGLVQTRRHDALPAAVLADVLGELGIVHDPLAERRAHELADGLLHRRVLHPAREQPPPRVLHGGIGILVGGDVQALAPGLLDLLHHLHHPAPVLLGAHLQMVDMDGDVRLPSYLEGLLQLLHDVEALAAQMHAVVAAVLPHHPGHGDHLIRVLRPFGVPRGGEPQRTLFHGLGHVAVHALLLLRAGRTFPEAHHHALDLLRRHAGSHVHGDAAGRKPLEVLAERAPVRLDAVPVAVLGHILLEHRPHQRRHGLAFADDVEGHALADLALTVAVRDQRLVAVGVHVDVSRRHHLAPDVDGMGPRARVQPAHGRDPAVLDGQVAVVPGVAGAVDDGAAVKHGIEYRHVVVPLYGNESWVLPQRIRARLITFLPSRHNATGGHGRCGRPPRMGGVDFVRPMLGD